LVRRIVFERLGLKVDSHVPELGRTVGDALLEPHRSYLPIVRPLLDTRIKGMAHITGGGITDNLPRILPPGTAATIDTGAWTIPPLFQWIQQAGQVPDDDMFRTFNMGIGLIVVTARDDAQAVRKDLDAEARVIGEILPGDQSVTYKKSDQV
jgi:phosphoribosylformylglycinamidine cyclo-ligase